MTHEEYLSQLETLGDSSEDASVVLSHVSICPSCEREQRFADRKITAAAGSRGDALEPLLRWGTAAAIVAVILIGLRHPIETAPKTEVRYRIVGNASGVVAYTPAGMVVGIAGTPARRGVR